MAHIYIYSPSGAVRDKTAFRRGIKRLQRSARRLRLLPRNPAHAPIEVQRGQDFAIEGMYCGLVRLG